MSMLETLISRFPIRRSQEQKEAFRAWFIQQANDMGYSARVEALKGHHNVIVGDPLTVRATFTAHYDTPARSLWPNLMMPRSRGWFYAYQFGVIFALIAIASAVGVPVGLLAGHWYPGFVAGWLVYMAFVLMMRLGPANPNNANDNTSGVGAILEAMSCIPEEDRSKIAFILFDDEEKGLLGSKAYAKAHPDFKENGFLVNLDCVGNGANMVLLASRRARETRRYAALTDALNASDRRLLHLFPLETSVANSDQKNFKCSMVIVACHQGKRLPYYTDRIHTKRDTVCSKGNLIYLGQGIARFAGSLAVLEEHNDHS